MGMFDKKSANAVLMILILYSTGAQAETGRLAAKGRPERSGPPASIFRVGGELSSLEGIQSPMGAGGTISYGFRSHPDVPVYFGMDMGVARWSVSYDTKVGEGDQEQTVTSKAPLTSIHFLMSVVYRFSEDAKVAHPYLGFSMGPSLVYAGSEEVTFAGQKLKKDSPSVKLQFLFRPGVELQLTDHIGVNVEPKVGIFSNQLLFAPHVGMTFLL